MNGPVGRIGVHARCRVEWAFTREPENVWVATVQDQITCRNLVRCPAVNHFLDGIAGPVGPLAIIQTNSNGRENVSIPMSVWDTIANHENAILNI